MAQQNWNYYVAPKGTESRTNALIGMVQNAANTAAANKAKEEQKTEARRKEAKRDAEITRNKNEKQLDQQQNSMQMYNKDIREATSEKGYVNGVLSKTYTMEDKKEFAGLSREVATKSCGACTEQLSRISEMKAEPGITKNFIELFSAEFEAMDTDIENNVFDKNNNSSLLALRGVLQGRKGYETGYDYGIRRLSDGSQELWITGPEGSIDPNTTNKENGEKEYVINSKQLGQAAENGGGVYASGYNINKELQSVDDSLKTIDDSGNPGDYKEDFLGKPSTRISSDGKFIETIRSRDPEAAELIYKQQITANATADFDNPGSAIATWNTKLAKKEDDQWSYSDWEELSDDEKNKKRRLYEDRMLEKFKSEIHTDFEKDIIVSKRDNPDYVEGQEQNIGKGVFDFMTEDLQSTFREAFPDNSDDLYMSDDGLTATIVRDGSPESTQGFDFTKKDEYVQFYTKLAMARGDFKGTSDAVKKAKRDFQDEVRESWKKAEAKRKEEAKKKKLELDKLEQLRNPIAQAPEGFEARVK